MKSLLISLLLMVYSSAHAVNLPQASSYATGGGSVTTGAPQGFAVPIGSLTTAGVIIICGGGTPGASFNYFGFYSQSSPGSLTSYQVPSGKTFYALNLWYFDSGAGDTVQFGYGTGTLASDNNSSAPSGNVIYGTGTTSSWIASTANAVTTYAYPGITFPANSYPWVRGNGTTNTHSVCLQGIAK